MQFVVVSFRLGVSLPLRQEPLFFRFMNQLLEGHFHDSTSRLVGGVRR